MLSLMCYVTDSTRSYARKISTGTVASQMIVPQCRGVTNDSGVATIESESSEKATETNGNASHDDHMTITSSEPNEVPIVSEHTNDQNVVTMPTESDQGNTDVTTTNGNVTNGEVDV